MPAEPTQKASPAALLALTNKGERGRLKIFLGAAPGVGKTYAMLTAARAEKEQGRDVVVGLVETHGRRETEALLEGFEVRFVGIFAPLDELEARERERGDRIIGLARWQFDRVHKGVAYDLEIDTTGATPMECAETIKEAFRL